MRWLAAHLPPWPLNAYLVVGALAGLLMLLWCLSEALRELREDRRYPIARTDTWLDCGACLTKFIVRAGERGRLYCSEHAWMGALLLFLVSGCAGARAGTLARHAERGVERKRTNNVHWLRADRELVNRKCTEGKKFWDAGSAYDPADPTVYARCCTVFPWRNFQRYQIWVEKGQEECIPHEFCHVEQYVADGFTYRPENHRRCHNFGWGRDKQWPTP